jgi:hypothetical protein
MFVGRFTFGIVATLNVDWCKVRFSELEIEPGIILE